MKSSLDFKSIISIKTFSAKFITRYNNSVDFPLLCLVSTMGTGDVIISILSYILENGQAQGPYNFDEFTLELNLTFLKRRYRGKATLVSKISST